MTSFYISDTHFGHANILTFKNRDGTPLRVFDSVEDMDEHMVKCWNERVNTQDTVYHLGDVAIHHRNLPILSRLNGRKILVKGNHDTAKLSQYMKYFADVRAYDRKDGIICSHMPIHPESIERFGINIHGHLHNNTLNDPRYFNVSVERINYTPISRDELLVKYHQYCIDIKEYEK